MKQFDLQENRSICKELAGVHFRAGIDAHVIRVPFACIFACSVDKSKQTHRIKEISMGLILIWSPRTNNSFNTCFSIRHFFSGTRLQITSTVTQAKPRSRRSNTLKKIEGNKSLQLVQKADHLQQLERKSNCNRLCSDLFLVEFNCDMFSQTVQGQCLITMSCLLKKKTSKWCKLCPICVHSFCKSQKSWRDMTQKKELLQR